ncbi:hypothetical protein RFI_10428, partial [Reticulomyxa filosa]
NVGKPGYKAFEVRMSDEKRRKLRIAEIWSKRNELTTSSKLQAALSRHCPLPQQPYSSPHNNNNNNNNNCSRYHDYSQRNPSEDIAMYDMLLKEVIHDTYDPFKADVWTLGIILYLLLFCRYPFRHADLDDELFVVKLLCWITLDIFNVLNQIFKPELLRIDADRLLCHPFCQPQSQLQLQSQSQLQSQVQAQRQMLQDPLSSSSSSFSSSFPVLTYEKEDSYCMDEKCCHFQDPKHRLFTATKLAKPEPKITDE